VWSARRLADLDRVAACDLGIEPLMERKTMFALSAQPDLIFGEVVALMPPA
jgi:hypothetical protein